MKSTERFVVFGRGLEYYAAGVFAVRKGSFTRIEEAGNNSIFSGAHGLFHFLEKLK
jgi:hypothetical protein